MQKVFSSQRVLMVTIVLILVLGGLAICKAASAAPTAEKPYYEGKVIILVVATGTGGGGDIYARLISRHLGRFIPGNPAVVVQDVPAAQGLTACNTVYASGPDGLKILFATSKSIAANQMRPKGIDYYLEKMYPIYCSPFGLIYYSKPNLVKEPKDIMQAKGLIFGHTTASGPNGAVFIFGREILGFKVDKWVFGYGSGGAARLALISGELNCTGEGSDAHAGVWKSLIDKGEASMVFQSGVLDADGNCVRDKVAPDIPTVPELYQQLNGKAPSGLNWEAYKLLLAVRSYDNAIAMGPRTPAHIAGIIQRAAVAMVKDSKFQEEIKKAAPGATHLVGDSLRGFAKAVAGSSEAVKYMKDYLGEKFGIVFE